MLRTVLGSAIAQFLEDPAIVEVMLNQMGGSGSTGYRVIIGDDYFTDAPWQDPAYLGEVVDDVLSPESLQPFIDGFWRLFGVEQTPPVGS